MRPPATPAIKEIGPHEAIASYLELAWPVHLPWTHFPAGEERVSYERVNRKTGETYRYSPAGQRLKRMGLKTGWFDFQFVLPNGQFASAEVKRPKGGKLSDEQIDHRAKLLAIGVALAEWRSPEDAEKTVTRWLDAFGLKPRATLMTRSDA